MAGNILILSDRVLLQVRDTDLPFDKVRILSAELGFSYNYVRNKLKSNIVTHDIEGLVLELLQRWVDQHGRGPNEVQQLKSIFNDIGHEAADAVLQEGKWTKQHFNEVVRVNSERAVKTNIFQKLFSFSVIDNLMHLVY